MEFGIFIPPVADTWKLVKRAEELGYSCAWLYDTQMLNSEVFVALTACAMNTTKIRLATGVMIPSNRIAPVAACGLATLNALAPGRVVWGLSTGSTARSTMGLPRMKQADMEEYIRVVKGLLAGETLEWEFEGKRRKIRFLDPDIGAINIKEPIPLHISAFGPKGRALIARHGAGWIDAVGNVARAKSNLADMQASWKEAGRDAKTLQATAAISGLILREGESWDSLRVRSIGGPSAMIMLHKLGETADYKGELPRGGLPPQLQHLVAPYREEYLKYQPEDARYLTNHKGHLMYLRPEEEPFATGELIRMTSLAGTKAEIREKLQELARAGFTHFGVNVGWRHPEIIEEWVEVFETL